MGNDTPLAVLSDQPQLLFNYFKQLFAQVTNPPIDPIREELVMSLISTLGAEQNLLEETPEHAPAARARASRSSPTSELARDPRDRPSGLRGAHAVDALQAADGGDGLRGGARRALPRGAEAAVADGANLLILSDRGVDAERAPIPTLLAVGAVHHHLIREGTADHAAASSSRPARRARSRTSRCSSATAPARSIPYLALRDASTSWSTTAAIRPGRPRRGEGAARTTSRPIDKGLLKIISKMGISTLQSYRGAQIFEAVGLAPRSIDALLHRDAPRGSRASAST